MELKGKKINFLGDSITAGSGTSCPDAIYHSVLKRNADLAESRNYGISGTRIARQQKITNEVYDNNDFCKRFEMMDDDADVVVVFGGTNDFGHGDAPFGTFEDRTQDTYCGALHYLMQGLIKKYPTSRIVFMTPIHRLTENEKDAKGHILKDYVDVIKKTGEYYSIPVLDLWSLSGIYPIIEAQKAAYCPDGLHPNDEGNKRIAGLLKNFLESL